MTGSVGVTAAAPALQVGAEDEIKEGSIDWYHQQMHKDASRLGELIEDNLADPELLNEWTRTLERLRRYSVIFTSMMCLGMTPYAGPDLPDDIKNRPPCDVVVFNPARKGQRR